MALDNKSKTLKQGKPGDKDIVDPTVEHMTTRYSLFFADDVVQESIQTKSKVKY